MNTLGELEDMTAARGPGLLRTRTLRTRWDPVVAELTAMEANSPATGAPTITGTAQVGETLTASTSGISDADGLANATFAYQWLADDADVSGATGASYTLAAADEGKAVKVRVSFTDDAGHDETLTSAATTAVAPKPNSPATGSPTITGTARVAETLTADTSGISDSDGIANATFSYQWLADDADIPGATGSTYTLAATDEGKAVKVRVSFTDDDGNDETLTSAATAAVAAAAPPAVTGVAVTSTPGANNTYARGETIRVTLTFGEAVDVTGTPRLKIDMDPADWGQKWAGYESGSGTASLTFSHLVVQPNISTQGIAVLANTLELNGGTIRSAASNMDANLAHTGLAHDSNHKVDWQSEAPEPSPASEPPAKPAGLTATATAGSLEVAVDWNDVDGAADYLVRWRPHGPDQDLNDGVRPTSSETQITVSPHGSWVVRVEACNDAGCGQAAALRFEVEEPTLPGQPENFKITTTAGELEVGASWDATDGATSYRMGWQPPGGSGLSAGALNVEGTSATVTVSGLGEWEFRLAACNDGGCGDPTTQTAGISSIVLKAQVTTATADAGEDQEVLTGATVTLSGSGSSTNVNPTFTYAWTQTGGTTVTLNDATTQSPTFTAPSVRDRSGVHAGGERRDKRQPSGHGHGGGAPADQPDQRPLRASLRGQYPDQPKRNAFVSLRRRPTVPSPSGSMGTHAAGSTMISMVLLSQRHTGGTRSPAGSAIRTHVETVSGLFSGTRYWVALRYASRRRTPLAGPGGMR